MLSFWFWNPFILAGISAFLIYGVTQGLRMIASPEHDEWTWTRWITYKLGDIAAIGFVFFAAICIQEDWEEGWYNYLPAQYLILIAIPIGSWLLQKSMVSRGMMTEEVSRFYSEIYHTLVPRGLFLAAMIPAFTTLVFSAHHPTGAFIGAMECIVVYLACFAYDNGFNFFVLQPQDPSIQKRGHR